MPRRFKYLFYIRLVAGLFFLFFGILHFAYPENFRNILQVSNLSLVDFNVIFVPFVESLIGVLFLIGLFTRIAGIMGCITMAIAFYATYTIMHLDSNLLPDGLTEKPFSPPLFVPVIMFILCLYLLIMGSGGWSIDRRNKKKQAEPR